MKPTAAAAWPPAVPTRSASRGPAMAAGVLLAAPAVIALLIGVDVADRLTYPLAGSAGAMI
jgi:hypothetical protein